MIRTQNLLLLVMLLPSLCVSAHAQKAWALHIDIPPADKAHGPDVSVGGVPAKGVRLDPVSGRWVVPVAPQGSQFVTSYVISLPEKNVVAVRIGLPARILEANPSVSLMPPSLTTVDELHVRSLWNTNEITTRPSDSQVQFRYLQDLLYIAQQLMSRPGASTHRPSAMRMTASFMLLQVVRNLSQNTWFLVDPSVQDVIDFSREDLRIAQEKGKCHWLGERFCHNHEVAQLLSTVRSLQSNRLRRMYTALVPVGSALDETTCSADQLRDMRDFYMYFHGATDQASSGAGVTETRILGDLAACYAVKALCTDVDAQSAIQTLTEGSQFIGEYGTRSTNRQLQALNNALTDLKAGRPAKCPVEGRH